MNCSNPMCMEILPVSSRNCTACGRDGGAPNVRAAQSPAEITALNVRYAGELAKASSEGYEFEFLRFETMVSRSSAVVCMPLTRLLPISSDPGSLLSTYVLQVEGESRLPVEGGFDNVRTSVEEAFFPGYSKYIRFAALSLTGLGQLAYGGCSVEFKDYAVADRTSTFDSPLFKFSKDHKLQLTMPIPVGYRADWPNRGKLAAAKLGAALKGTHESDAAELLLPTPDDTTSDCMEVHIFGPVSKSSIQKIVMKSEARRADRALQQAVFENFQDSGIAVEVIK